LLTRRPSVVHPGRGRPGGGRHSWRLDGDHRTWSRRLVDGHRRRRSGRWWRGGTSASTSGAGRRPRRRSCIQPARGHWPPRVVADETRPVSITAAHPAELRAGSRSSRCYWRERAPSVNRASPQRSPSSTRKPPPSLGHRGPQRPGDRQHRIGGEVPGHVGTSPGRHRLPGPRAQRMGARAAGKAPARHGAQMESATAPDRQRRGERGGGPHHAPPAGRADEVPPAAGTVRPSSGNSLRTAG
jgi:hypothetical protein